ncbi:MAG TPA: cell division protein FtsQ/DivIB [Aliidongia sp.]|nr:cell division protein FtsQ/DivIB [Aliidongia sp.]
MGRVKPAQSLDAARLQLLRRRIQRYMPRHPVKVLAAGASCLALLVIGLAAADRFDHGSRLSGATLAATAAVGFAVADIQVEGRDMTGRDEILRMLGATRGTPILSIDPVRVKQQLETLPWIRSALVERRLPDTIYIQLAERKPLALWQRQGKTALIDHEGVVVTTEHLERYSELLLVVGDGAPLAAEALIGTLKTEPALMKHVTAAVRVSERRWDLHLDNGIVVELPELNYADAWSRLAQIDRDHGLMARDIERVDLRLPDRTVIKVTPEPVKPPPAKHPRVAARST